MWVTDVALIPDQMGAVVTKLSPEGEVLMTLGTPGVTGRGRDTFNRPSAVDLPPRVVPHPMLVPAPVALAPKLGPLGLQVFELMLLPPSWVH